MLGVTARDHQPEDSRQSGTSLLRRFRPKATEPPPPHPQVPPSPFSFFSGDSHRELLIPSLLEHADRSSEDKVSMLRELGTSLKLLLLLEGLLVLNGIFFNLGELDIV